MGARQSKRSVDITTTPKKGEGEVAAIGEEKIEKLGDADIKAVVTNGTAAHTDIEFADKDEEGKETEEKPSIDIKENGLTETSDGEKTPDKEAPLPAAGDQPPVTEEKTTENNEKTAETPDAKKQKEKKKKKWSLRSISFSKKDKSKPSKDKDKNGEVGEVNEEKAEEAIASPTNEVVAKIEEAKVAVEEAKAPVTNGDASKEELAEKIPDTVAKNDTETKKPEESVEQTPVEAIKEEAKVEVPAKIEECAKPEELKTVVEESPAAPPAVEEVKEVGSEEVPPPLPSSNPPSQVMVFAESTKANVLSADELAVSDKAESHISEPTSPKSLIETPEKIEDLDTVLSAPTPPPPFEEDPIPTNVETKAPTPLSSPVEKAAPTPVEQTASSPVEETASTPVEQTVAPSVEPSIESASLFEAEIELGVEIDNVSTIESSPVMIEALPKVADEPLSDTNTVGLEKGDCSSNCLLPNVSETFTSTMETEQVSIKSDNESSLTSVPSIPNMVEEKIPIVSSAGDMLNLADSEISVQSDHISLQEMESNLNLKESLITPEPSLVSEGERDELSIIPEVDSQESKLDDQLNGFSSHNDSKDKEQSSPSSSQKDIEPVCNADSLPDLSTESLPSLPEPTDSLLEPMSLPPLDSVPEPLVDDNLPISPEKLEPPSPKPVDTEHPVVLTNGNATNGLKASPTADDAESQLPPPLDGPLKQISAPEPISGETCVVNESVPDAPAESVEQAPAAAE